MTRGPERQWVCEQIVALFVEAFCLLSPCGPRIGGVHGQGVEQSGTQEVEATKSPVPPTPRTATVAQCHRAQAFARLGTMGKPCGRVLLGGRCCGLNAVSASNSYIVVLTPILMVFGGGNCGRGLGL